MEYIADKFAEPTPTVSQPNSHREIDAEAFIKSLESISAAICMHQALLDQILARRTIGAN